MTNMNNGGFLAAASTQCNNQEELDARLRALNNLCRGTRGESQQLLTMPLRPGNQFTGLGLPLLIEWPCVPAVHMYNAANV